MNKLKFLAKAALSILIVFLLVYSIGISKLANTISGINLRYFPLLLVSLSIEFLLAATTLKILLESIREKIGFWRILNYHLRSFSIGLLVPAKIGEVSFVYFLNKEGVDVGKGSAVFVLDKLITFVTLAVVSFFGMFILLDGKIRIAVISSLGVVVAGMLFFLLSFAGREFVKKYILRKYANIFTGFSKTFFEIVKEKPHVVMTNFFISFVRWSIGAFTVYLMFLAFNFDPGFFYVWLIKPLTIIVSLVPFTIAGLGIREGSAVLLFGVIGVPAEITAGVYFMFAAINYIGATILNLYYLYKPKNALL